MGGRRVLITGGAGFIGSHLADHLLAAGDEVRALDVLADAVGGVFTHAIELARGLVARAAAGGLQP